MPAKKRIHLYFLETACAGSYLGASQWRTREDTSRSKDTLKYYTDLARLAEKGKVSAIFLADWYGGLDVYGGSMDAMLHAGHQVAHLDPLPIAMAMATVTESLAVAVTMSTSHVTPYALARQFSTLDHLTGGRFAWNVVTSWAKSAAKALGHEDVVRHNERFSVADEFMDIVYKFWESSWAPYSAAWDAASGIAYDPARIKEIEHQGRHFSMFGRSQVHSSSQRTPMLFRAGASQTGAAFATKHTEAIFLTTATLAQAKQVIANARQLAADSGRDPKSLKFFPCIVPFIGRTEEEAKQKWEYALQHANPKAGLARFSGYTGIDFAEFPLDEPIDLTGHAQAEAIQYVFKALEASSADQEGGAWTPKRLGVKMALGGLHPTPIGSAEQVADVFEEWSSELGADCDGFNVSSVTVPGSWEDVVELLVPVLQRRGIYWKDYDVPGGTLRENLLGERHLGNDHYGSQSKLSKKGHMVQPAKQRPEKKEDKTASPATLEVLKALEFEDQQPLAAFGEVKTLETLGEGLVKQPLVQPAEQPPEKKEDTMASPATLEVLKALEFEDQRPLAASGEVKTLETLGEGLVKQPVVMTAEQEICEEGEEEEVVASSATAEVLKSLQFRDNQPLEASAVVRMLETR